MRHSSTKRFAFRSWMIVLLIGLVFVGVEFGLRFEVAGADAPSWLDLALLLGAYLFVFCLKPLQRTVQRKLCQHAIQRTRQKSTG